MKKCSKCKQIKDLTDFYDSKETKDGKNCYCKQCHSDASRKWREKNRDKVKRLNRKGNYKKYYGITLEEYEHLFYRQGGKCKICKTHQTKLKKLLSVDHDHNTNKVRGLLCQKCNQGLGMFNDCPDSLMQAAFYLKHSYM